MRLMYAANWLVIGGLVALGGCVGRKAADPTARPVTDVDPAMAEAPYWLAQPATDQIVGNDFTRMWEAAEQVAREYRFGIFLRDFRGGQLVTQPLMSKQFFEVWKKDASTARDLAEGTADSIRRTAYFQFTQNDGGTYTLTPKVVVERLSIVEAKYWADMQLPPSYWYALRRDAVLERRLAESLRKRLEGVGVLAGS